MGEGMGGNIARGVANQKVDLLVNERDGAGRFHRRQAFLGEVRRVAETNDVHAYLTFLRDQAGVTQIESDYLRDRWYNEGPRGFWSWLQPVFPIIVRGLIKSLEAAGDDLPLVTYWAPIGTQVEVIVGKTPYQVTRIVVTPITTAPTTQRPHPTPLWVVRRGAVGETPRETPEAVLEGVHGGDRDITTWQVKELWVPPPPPPAAPGS